MCNKIELFDNNCNSDKRTLKDLCSGNNDYKRLRESLKQYSGRKLLKPQESSPNLIIFPLDIKNSKDKIQESALYTLENEYTDTPEETQITTSNLMGFFGVDDYEFQIHSRFDEKYKNDNFLHYMLTRVFCPNIIDLPHTIGQNRNLCLLMFAFPPLLVKALNQGIIKEYQTHKYNNPNIRGVIDVQRHIQLNIPFNGNVAYRTREHSRDNYTTELIRHTIEFIRTTEFGKAILEQNEDTKDAVNTICQITSNYSRNDRAFIIGRNLNSRIHPFYSEYMPLQRLCVQILRYEGIDFIGHSEGLYGILFDGAWLWEEYINTVISQMNIIHAENKICKNGIKLFSDSNYRNYPDFYKTGKLILDAKYKKIAKNDELKITVDSSDLHQVIAYMRVLDASVGGFLYPLAVQSQMKFNSADLLIGTLNGILSREGKIYHFPMQIPELDCEYTTFKNEIVKNENLLVNDIVLASGEKDQ